MTRLRVPAVLFSLATAALLAGCTGSTPAAAPAVTVTTTVTATVETPGPTVTEMVTVTPEPTEPDGAAQPLPLGQVDALPNGLEVTVSATDAGLEKSSDLAGAKRGDHLVAVKVRVHNGGTTQVDTSGFLATVTYGPDGEEAPDVFDDKFGGIDFTQVLTAGAVQSKTGGFAVPTGSPITVQFSPGGDATTVGQWAGKAS